jgi:hypothetical protein
MSQHVLASASTTASSSDPRVVSRPTPGVAPRVAPGVAPGAIGITAAFLDKILGFLAQFFLAGGSDDIAAARAIASEMLASYGARTNKEIRLAALNIAFSFGALDSLGRSAAPDLPVNQVLRLRGNANALHRAAYKSQDALDRLQSVEAEPIAEQPEPDLPASAATADLVAFSRPAPLSRQQRRAAERQAEKLRLRQQEEARRAERAARLSAQRQPAPAPMAVAAGVAALVA